MEAITIYIKKFCSLRVDRSKGSPAPHKPVLLLAILDSIHEGEIIENKILITPELVSRFKSYWTKLVTHPGFTPNFSLPYFHLRSEGFWHLQAFLGGTLILTSSHSIKSFAQLKQVIQYAYFDDALFTLVKQEGYRLMLRKALLEHYFPQASLTEDNPVAEAIISQILNESPAEYRARVQAFDEEEVFVRGGLFKREIPKIYDYTCAISRMRVVAQENVQMIDACHIVPFAQSGDDTITNGISLCPNLHRAFDRGLISIGVNYKVLVKPFAEVDSYYSIRQFEGSDLLLPHHSRYFPSQENLLAHRLRHNFQ